MKIYPPEGVILYRAGLIARPTDSDLVSGAVEYWNRSAKKWSACMATSLTPGDIWRRPVPREMPPDYVVAVADQFFDLGDDPDANT